MLSSKQLAILVIAAVLCLSVASATAQQVFACYTLHNDLANFDRRARQVAHYFPGQAGRDVYERSHIGGSDVIRLRIINEMHRFGCPLPRGPGCSRTTVATAKAGSRCRSNSGSFWSRRENFKRR
jgi:hypothetical protein